MDHIASILAGLLGRTNLSQGLRNYQLFPQWEQVVGGHLAGHTRPLKVQAGALLVWVDNSTLLQHLTYLTPQMLQRIRELAPKATIQTIRFTLSVES